VKCQIQALGEAGAALATQARHLAYFQKVPQLVQQRCVDPICAMLHRVVRPIS
jgi:hypothetical protein